MSQKTSERLRGKRWRERAEEMLTLARTAPQATRAQMERLAADWLLIAELEDERQRPAHDDFRPADKRRGNEGKVRPGGGAGRSSSK
jgi:hypothetical protein